MDEEEIYAEQLEAEGLNYATVLQSYKEEGDASEVPIDTISSANNIDNSLPNQENSSSTD